MTYLTTQVGDAVIMELDRPAQPDERRHITPLAFIQRFTDDEAIAIDIASRADTEQGARLRRYLQKVNLAAFVDLDGENVQQGVPSLELMGLIAPGRAAEIVGAQVRPEEKA